MQSTLIRFSGYAAAAVIFVSWFINNIFVTSLQEDTQALDAIRSEQADAANLSQLAELTDGQRELFKKLSAVQSGSSESEDQADLEWVESLESSSARLASSAVDLRDLATRVAPNDQDELLAAIKLSVEETAQLSAAIRDSAETYKQDKSAESLIALEATDATFETLDAALTTQFEQMDAYIEAEHERSASAAETAGVIAYLFYALGMALGGAGKWLENKQRKAAVA